MTLTKTRLTFDQFLNYDFPAQGSYELVNGEIIKIQSTRKHDNLAEFITDTFKFEVKRLNLNYRVSGRITIRTLTTNGKEQGRIPDVSVVDKKLWDANLSAYTAFIEPLQLAVEIVSTNWEDDYIDKLDEYQRLGISEYWIIDYLAIGSRNYLGNPKQPTIFVYLLNEQGIYQPNAYQATDQIISPTFPELNLTVDQVFAA